jgi:type IV secretory pathway TraG/TraD family ATPase VirD4
MFITSNHTDLTLTRPLLTLWMDLAVNSLMRLPRTRDLRTWFLFDEVHALHTAGDRAWPADCTQLRRRVRLGIHSFDKLVETYGEQGAVSLTGLARTKLILATADYRSAERCAEFIGNREVRQMDEAYSYGYNNTRDASTLTPRKMIEPLVIPDDITNLPSMHGFIKFPDGFPAARIKLQWQDYPQVAEGFLQVTKMEPTPYVPPKAKAPAAPKRAEEGRVVASIRRSPDRRTSRKSSARNPARRSNIRTAARKPSWRPRRSWCAAILALCRPRTTVRWYQIRVRKLNPPFPRQAVRQHCHCPMQRRGLTTAHVIKSPEQIAIERARHPRL